MNEDNMPVLKVTGLKKSIKGKEIIKGLDFELRKGEVFGFLGPNGSGKTTTIRMLVGLIRPTAGVIEIGGYNLHRYHNQALRQIGCIVENPELYPFLTGQENLEHFAVMLPNVDQQRIREVVRIVGMDNRIHDKVKTYSLGMRQRLGIAQALLGKPKLLILDEPTNGLDPQGIAEMRNFIRELAGLGLSVLVSSHLLSEIQQMCDRVAIISHGSLLAYGDVDELLSDSASSVKWRVQPAQLASRLLADAGVEILETAGQLNEDEVALQNPGECIHTRMDADDIPLRIRELVQAGVEVYGVENELPTLEQLFLNLTRGESIE